MQEYIEELEIDTLVSRDIDDLMPTASAWKVRVEAPPHVIPSKKGGQHTRMLHRT